MESLFRQYCQALGTEPKEKGTAKSTWKFWNTDKENVGLPSLPAEGSYVEGGIVMRMHLARERDPRVIRLPPNDPQEEAMANCCGTSGANHKRRATSIVNASDLYFIITI